MTEPEAVIREALMRLDASRRGSINYAVYEAKKDGLAALAALVAERDRLVEALSALLAEFDDDAGMSVSIHTIAKARAALAVSA